MSITEYFISFISFNKMSWATEKSDLNVNLNAADKNLEEELAYK